MIGKLCSRSVRCLLAVVLAAGGLVGGGGAAPPVAAAADAAFVPVVPGRLMDTRPGEATVDGAQAGGGRVGAVATGYRRTRQR